MWARVQRVPPPLIPPHEGEADLTVGFGSIVSLPLVGRVAQLGEAVAELGGGSHRLDHAGFAARVRRTRGFTGSAGSGGATFGSAASVSRVAFCATSRRIFRGATVRVGRMCVTIE